MVTQFGTKVEFCGKKRKFQRCPNKALKDYQKTIEDIQDKITPLAERQRDFQFKITELEDEIASIETDVDGVIGKLFPVGSIYISTSATAPTFGGTSWQWVEIMLPVTQGDLIDGNRSFVIGAGSGSIHFWKRTE